VRGSDEGPGKPLWVRSNNEAWLGFACWWPRERSSRDHPVRPGARCHSERADSVSAAVRFVVSASAGDVVGAFTAASQSSIWNASIVGGADTAVVAAGGTKPPRMDAIRIQQTRARIDRWDMMISSLVAFTHGAVQQEQPSTTSDSLSAGRGPYPDHRTSVTVPDMNDRNEQFPQHQKPSFAQGIAIDSILQSVVTQG
jgi:hypothetical protein